MNERRLARRLVEVYGPEAAYVRVYERCHPLQHFGRDWGGRDRYIARIFWARVARHIQRIYEGRKRASRRDAVNKLRQRLTRKRGTPLQVGKGGATPKPRAPTRG